MTRTEKNSHSESQGPSRFERKFFDSDENFTFIGSGSLGGKAQGLVFIRDILREQFNHADFPGISVSIPTMTVITTEFFDEFMKLNNLYEIALSDLPDDRISHAFQNTELPAKLVGDLWALISKVHSPLAIRSSSLLEDALYEPFAGIYGTKMTPNNQLDTEGRFHKLVEAIKYVYASTFFRAAKNYFKATRHRIEDEKMAVIIQEVVGQRFDDHYYPTISGVARSYNFYPAGNARPEEGIVNLALGLGRTIVDEGISWSYSPAYPRANPPYNSIRDLLKESQNSYWAVNMGKPPAFDPVKETEYLLKLALNDAEKVGSLKYIASTYDAQSDRLYPGAAGSAPKLINFAPILQMGQMPLNEIIQSLLKICSESMSAPVEIEFAVTLDPKRGVPARFGFLQVRPMVVSKEKVEISRDDLESERVLVASENVLGNGIVDHISDVVFVKPESFKTEVSAAVADELEKINNQLLSSEIPYLLLGFGRWGSSDPWLGIPVNWGQISGAKVIVEATLPHVNVDLSQGSHFFHNITSFQVLYFSVRHSGKYEIDWQWLNQQAVVRELNYTKHVKLASPLRVKVDGRSGRGVILK